MTVNNYVFRPGSKHPNDTKIYKIEPLVMKDMAIQLGCIFLNENVIYPRPKFSGSGKMMGFIMELKREVDKLQYEVLNRTALREIEAIIERIAPKYKL